MNDRGPLRLAIFTGVLLAAGCVTATRLASLHDRASFEFSCRPEQIAVTPLGYDAVGISVVSAGAAGCGQRAVYVINHDGVWVRDGSVVPTAPGATY